MTASYLVGAATEARWVCARGVVRHGHDTTSGIDRPPWPQYARTAYTGGPTDAGR